MNIVTNYHKRDLIYGWELDSLEDWQSESDMFFRYRGNLYCLSEFLRYPSMWGGKLPDEFKGWDSYMSDSFFSGILIKLVDDDQIIVGTYYS